jgi:hypothetical protein
MPPTGSAVPREISGRLIKKVGHPQNLDVPKEEVFQNRKQQRFQEPT